MSENGRELKASRIAQIESGRLALMDMQDELEDQRAQYADLMIDHKQLQTEHDALKLAYARMLTELDTYREERDRAVTRRAELEVVLDTVLTVLQRFQAPPSAREECHGEEEGGAEQEQRH